MNTDLTPLGGRAQFSHTYVLASDKTEGQGERLVPSMRSLTRLQRGRLAAQEATQPYFKGEKLLVSRTVRELKEENITSWNKIIDAKILILGQKGYANCSKKNHAKN